MAGDWAAEHEKGEGPVEPQPEPQPESQPDQEGTSVERPEVEEPQPEAAQEAGVEPEPEAAQAAGVEPEPEPEPEAAQAAGVEAQSRPAQLVSARRVAAWAVCGGPEAQIGPILLHERRPAT
jgi:hypothetical protein